VNKKSRTAKSRPGAPANSSQSRAPKANTDRPASALERTAGWFLRLVAKPAVPSPSPTIKNVDVEGDPLLAFASEDAPVSVDEQPLPQSPDTPDVPDMLGMPGISAAPDNHPQPVVRVTKLPARARRAVSGVALLASAAIIVIVGVAVFGTLYRGGGGVGASAAEFGTFTIETEPAGADVVIDGQSRGSTPLKVSLPPGPHTAVVRHGTEERRVPLMLAAGAVVVHHMEFTLVKPAPIVGGISVVTDPPGARVLIDGHLRGASPITLNDLPPASYKVSVSSETGAVDRTVAVQAGETVSVVFSLPKVSGPLAGWAAVSSPFDVQIMEDNNLVGTGRSSKIMMPAGKHTFAIVNQALGYQDTRTVDVAAGKVATIQVDAPKVIVNVNARPWADVFIDGKNVGQTPIGNLSLAIGTYEVIFRHPEFGERRQTFTVTVKGTNRIAVDLTK
jgi:hypothetical protein